MADPVFTAKQLRSLVAFSSNKCDSTFFGPDGTALIESRVQQCYSPQECSAIYATPSKLFCQWAKALLDERKRVRANFYFLFISRENKTSDVYLMSTDGLIEILVSSKITL